MNKLVRELIRPLLEQESVTALYGGGFKPPTKGHFDVVKKTLESYPEIDKLIIYVGAGVRDGIGQEQSLEIWGIYKDLLGDKVEIIPSKAPIGDIYRYVKNNPEEEVYFTIGAREGREDDMADIATRTRDIETKYPNTSVKVITTADSGMSGTNARKAIKDPEEFTKYLPAELPQSEKETVYNIVNRSMLENVANNHDGKAAPYGSGYDPVDEKKDPKKGTGKKPKGSSRRLYTDEDPKDTVGIKFSTRQDIVDTLNKTSFKAKSHARQSQIINLIHQRVRAAYGRAKDPAVKKRLKNQKNESFASTFGGGRSRYRAIEKRGNQYYYVQDNPFSPGIRQEFGPYKTKEQAKKKMNSFPPSQNYRDINENASYSKDIDIKGKIDQLTQHMINKGYNIEPLPGLEFVDGDTENARDFFGKTAYYDPNTQTIVLYTEGRHPKDIARSYAHEMIHHIQNLEGRLDNINTTNTQEDDYLNDIEAEANLKGTMTFRNWTDSLNEDGQETSDANMDDYKKQNNPSGKVKDPFGLNAYAYELALGLEEEIINEGVYDSLVTRLTNITIKKWVSDFKSNPKIKQSFIDIDIDEEDSKGRPIEFNYVGRLIFDKKVDGYEVDGTSNSGEEEDKIPFIAALFTINPSVLPNAWSKISADVSDVIRHEIEHLTQAGDNVRTGKYKDDDIQIRDMINKLKLLPYKNYYLLDKEVDAMLQGLYLKAKKTKKPFADVINNYLNIAPGLENKEDKEMVLDLWRRRRKALSLPVFENEEKVMDYKIHLDMDGVITDFNSQFEELTGMMPNDFESKYGIKGFWEAIDKAGVGFWRGMKWMPDGEELYNKVSQFDHELLSSPSRGDSSKIGKRLWRRDKTPNTKLTLAYSANKKNYAAPNHILIDDRADNINQWKNAGGIGILHTSTASTLAKLKELGL